MCKWLYSKIQKLFERIVYQSRILYLELEVRVVILKIV